MNCLKWQEVRLNKLFKIQFKVITDFDCAQSDSHPERSRRVFSHIKRHKKK